MESYGTDASALPIDACWARKILLGHADIAASKLLMDQANTQHLSGLEESVLRNIAAAGELSEIVRTSFGPNGELRGLLQETGTPGS